MATNHGHENGGENNPSVGYDKSDLSARGILIFFLVLAIFAVCVHLGVLGMWVGMSKIADKHDPEISPLAPKAVTPRAEILMNTANINVQKFPEPRLQNDDTGDMARFLQKETVALTAEPWQDEQGNVHLPIDQAMKVVASRLPVRAGGTTLQNYPGAGRESAGATAGADSSAKPDGMNSEAEKTPATK
jgi:hypothetical protein